MKESIHTIEPQSVLFRETFNSAFDVRRNGGSIQGVTFINGGIITGTTSGDGINYPLPSYLHKCDEFTLHAIFKNSSSVTSEQIASSNLKNDYRIYISSSDKIVAWLSNAGAKITTTDFPTDGKIHHIFITYSKSRNSVDIYLDDTNIFNGLAGVTISAINTTYYLGGRGSTNNFSGNLKYYEIYNYALTASEISNLYEGKRFRELRTPNEILFVSAQSGTISDKWNNVIVNTAVDVFKIGSTRVGKYDGSTSLLNIDSIVSTLSATETGTFMAWINTTDASVTQEIISFGDTDQDTRIQFDIDGAGLLRALVGESGVTKWALDTDAITIVNNKSVHVALVQDGTSPVLYVNAEAVAQTFSTSTDKTYWFSDMAGLDNGRIGCGSWNSGGNATFFSGLIGNNTRIIKGVLIAQQISQVVTSEKWMYGL